MAFDLKKIPGLKKPGILRFSLISVITFILLFLLIDLIFPVNLKPKTQSRIILSSNGTPLRSFADKNGVYRYPVKIEEISKYYIEALLGYEDRWFYYHPGVNPVSLVRSAFQLAKNRRIISGGSTLTMQVARLKRPFKRSISGKLLQIFTALQLELHFTKDEILNFYLNHAPFGGTFEGVQAASFSYFGHSAKHLTRAQAALLAVMPQAPSRYRPDRFPKRAERARNKLLKRLLTYKVWSRKEINDAKMEKVAGWPIEKEIKAPLLSRRLHRNFRKSQTRIETFINYPIQLTIEQLTEDYTSNLPPNLSTAVMVMNNRSGRVTAYKGSADFFNLSRFGHVDMIMAKRSPGSTMKPFIYGLAMDKGLIHSQSLLMDAPIHFGDYKPVNFHRNFSGPVSVTHALYESLNLPAVQVMDHLEPRFFYSKMVNSGFAIKLPKHAKPNLAMALGGFSTNLENLVLAYSALGRKGKTVRPKYTKYSETSDLPLLSEGAAWIIHNILLPEENTKTVLKKRYAVKTGTSYGFRDAWAIGVNREYTVGVWVGRPDGVPVPGHFGSQTAVPLLKSVFNILPKHRSSIEKPESVTEVKICWPDSQLAASIYGKNDMRCETPRKALVLNRTTPKTLSATKDSKDPAVPELNLTITSDGKYRIPPGCNKRKNTKSKKIQLWPKTLEIWLPYSMKRKNIIPPVLPGCRKNKDILVEESISIIGLSDKEKVIRKEGTNDYPTFDLRVQGGNGPWYWLINSKLTCEGKTCKFKPEKAGTYQILAVDQSGMMDKIRVEIIDN